MTEHSEGPTERSKCLESMLGGSRGMLPLENFEKLDAFSCILRHFGAYN